MANDNKQRLKVVANYSDPTQPNYRPSYWWRAVERWIVTQDWYGDIWYYDILKQYITKKESEDPDDYKVRVTQACPDRRFKQAVDDSAALLNETEVTDFAPRTFKENKENVDGLGASFRVYDYTVTQRYFRDGMVIMGADTPIAPTEEEQRRDRRPTLIWVPITDIYSPEYTKINGIPVLSRISIHRERQVVKDTAALGKVSHVVHDFYDYQLKPIRDPNTEEIVLGCMLTVWEQTIDEQGQTKLNKRLGPFPVLGADQNPLPRLPFTEKFSTTNTLDFDYENDPIPPLYYLLQLTITYTNKETVIDTFEDKVMIPTIARFFEGGVPTVDGVAVPPDFIGGASRTCDMSENSRVEVIEPTGNGAQHVYDHQRQRDEQVAKQDNKFFHTQTQMTATEAAIENEKAKLNLPAIASKKEAAYTDLMDIWAYFTDPNHNGDLPTEPPVKIGVSQIKANPDPQDVMQTQSAVTNGIIDGATALRRLVRIGWLKDEDITAPIDPPPNQPLGGPNAV